MLTQKEYQEFFQISRANGYSHDEFEISNAFFIRRDDCACRFLSTVNVRYIPKNACRSYTAGCGSYWLLNFENDLIDGYFKMFYAKEL